MARSVERPRGDGLDTLIAGTLQANGKAAGSATQQDAEAGMLIPMAFGGNNQAGEIHVATACRAHAGPHLDFESETFTVLAAPIAFSSKDCGDDACYDLSPTLCAGNHAGSHANAGSPPAIAFDARRDCVSSTSVFGALGTSSPQAQAVCITGDITHTLKAEGFDASEDGTGRGQPIVAAFAENSRAEIRLEGGDGSRTGALSTGGGKPGQGTPMVLAGMAVRRLTPRECERLQDMPDDYTLIPFGRAIRPEKLEQDWIKYLMRGGVMTRDQVARAAADGPRYKAIGNSWAVSNVAWLGRRIDAAMRANFAHEREIARVA
ncbi:hypothetical protein [Janthinobacterium lividum]|uniref:hypothetical protein n=1 Tax=Janthinobacterium lividum TaxID=29581 RepID=UPI00201D7518|nr:hypothetical protein [Janthinobacterium lividum]